MLKATVIIPTFGRMSALDIAIRSVLTCRGSEEVEILVIDDASPEPVSSPRLREQDRVIRLKQNSGPAVARNRGLAEAKGEMIYFLDSDDRFLERDFIADHEDCRDEKALYYCDIDSNGIQSCYPEKIERKEYLSGIFFQFPFIGQTSSLCFPAGLNLRFDESLPRHQDWDIAYHGALSKGIPMKKIAGRIFFDRSDRNSISRQADGTKSLPWVQKMITCESTNPDFDRDQFEFHVLGRYPSQYSWSAFFRTGLALLISRRTSLRSFVVRGVHRGLSWVRST